LCAKQGRKGQENANVQEPEDCRCKNFHGSIFC
jgi:hypothetical protein